MRIRASYMLLLAILPALPTALSAQIGVGVRVGTLGLAGDVAIALGERGQLRGGLGLMPIEPTLSISDFEATVELPSSFITFGLDFFPTGSGFRIGGGLLLKPDDPALSAACTGEIEVGDQSYDCGQVGTVTATVASKSAAPFVMIGFGKHASGGIGLFLDLGAAFIGESEVTLSADGSLSGNQTFQQELEREETEWQEKVNDYKIYPIVNLGLRIGVGG